MHVVKAAWVCACVPTCFDFDRHTDIIPHRAPLLVSTTSSAINLVTATPCVVQESIALLMACRRFSIEGADRTIRKMLPLIFSREQGELTFPRVTCGLTRPLLMPVQNCGICMEPCTRYILSQPRINPQCKWCKTYFISGMKPSLVNSSALQSVSNAPTQVFGCSCTVSHA